MTRNQNDPREACGCCEGIEKLTPLPTANRPGLDRLTYRVGTHSAFLETMKARLTDLYLELEEGEEKKRPLGRLTTREASDPAIALLDAWATVGDVLTFYQERIANEGYLRTATERRSILELARLIGYALGPGVAASVYLAFTLENGKQVEIPAGTRARSKPGPGESPQAFETSKPLQARAAWNALKPRMSRPQYITKETLDQVDLVHFEGTDTNLGPNDPLLFDFDDDEPVVRFIQSVDVQQAKNRTDVKLQTPTVSGQAMIVRDVTAKRQEIRQTTREYLNLEDYEVSLDTQMARRVVGTLEEMEARLAREEDPAVIESAVDEALLSLREEHRTAETYRYENLEPWVGGLVERLERDRAELADIRTGGAGTRALAAASDRRREEEGGNRSEPNALTDLGDLVGPLLEPPSEQPANALHLRRTIRQVFGADTDFAPRLLTTVKPQLKGTLYPAWGSAEVTTPPALKAVDVLRRKASPFGHNAPLKPIFDEEGRIDHYEEWPLGELTLLEITLVRSRLDIETTAPPTLQARIGIRQGQRVKSSIMPIPLQPPDGTNTRESDVLVNGETVSVTTVYGGQGSLEQVTFDFSKRDRAIALKFLAENSEEARDSFQIQISDGDVTVFDETISAGQRVARQQEGHTVKASYPPAPGEPGFLSISDGAVSAEARRVITLDTTYDAIVPASLVALKRPGWWRPQIFEVIAVDTVSRADYGISGKATQLALDRAWLTDNDFDLSLMRGTSVLAVNEGLSLAETPMADDVAGMDVNLDSLYDGLEGGRWVIVSGERTDIQGTSGVMASELVMLASVTQGPHTITTDEGEIDLPGDTVHTKIHFANGLSYTYKRDTVTIHGNVVKATHGETREEVLGSGDGSRARQQFELKKSPLTYLAAPTPSGVQSTLEVRVNDVLWHEAANLFELEPLDRGYVTRTDNEDKVTVMFGDGTHGARLPSGIENVQAVYRKGIGKPGNVDAEQISLLATRPLGVKEVLNPLPASGGADRESRDQARRNAPLAVMALDRLVSVRDYADFARTFAGIGKASAAELSDGQREVVHLTIAGADDIPIDRTSDLYKNLRRALLTFGDPYQPLQIDVREIKLLVIRAKVRLLPDYAWEFVAPEIRTTVLDTFSFQRRELGQDVTRGEVISTIQHVPGVAYVDLDILDSVREGLKPSELKSLVDRFEKEDQPQRRVAARLAKINRGVTNPDERIMPAQIAYLDPDLPDTLMLEEL